MQNSYLRKPPARVQGGSANLFDMDTYCSDALSDLQILRQLQTEPQRKKNGLVIFNCAKT